jgi:hypothetical protein
VSIGVTPGPGASRATLDDGIRRRDAQVLTVHNGDPAERERYILDVAAHELDKALELRVDGFQQKLGAYLATAQLEALEARRELLVKHFDELIARTTRCSPQLGERA